MIYYMHMHFYNISLQYIPEGEIGFVAGIQGIFDEMLHMMSNAENKGLILPKLFFNCHVATRLVVDHIPELRVVEGRYYSGWPAKKRPGMCHTSYCAHSWLLSPSGKTIFDPYPIDLVAAGTVIAMPVELPDEFVNTPYHGAAKYFECKLDSKLFNLDEILTAVDAFRDCLKTAANY